MGPFLIVGQSSAVLPIINSVASPIVGFDRNHSEIAKPTGPDDDVYKWVMDRLDSEYERLDNWDAVTANAAPQFKLCANIPVLPEPP